jgi:transposase
MSLPLKITIKESLKELRMLQGKHGELIGRRLRVLIEIKRHEKDGISKRELSKLTGVNHNSIVKWRKIYNNYGIDPLLKHGRVSGKKKSILTQKEHNTLSDKVHNPKNGIRGYTELLEWANKEFSKNILYISLVKYSERHFGTKIKVARKSHAKKDEKAVEAFKKTSVTNAKK